jgi:hypothetical protein
MKGPNDPDFEEENPSGLKFFKTPEELERKYPEFVGFADYPEYRHIQNLEKKLPRFPEGADLTAAQYIEYKRRLLSQQPQGLQPLREYAEKDVADTEAIFETKHVPLTVYVNGERRVIGDAQVESTPDGLMVTLACRRYGNALKGLSIGFKFDDEEKKNPTRE